MTATAHPRCIRCDVRMNVWNRVCIACLRAEVERSIR